VTVVRPRAFSTIASPVTTLVAACCISASSCGAEAPPMLSATEAGADGGAADGAFDSASAACSPYVTNVVGVDYGPGAGFGQTSFPTVVKGPPKGGGCCQGSLHVLSLGSGGSITVEFGQVIVDGPGPDFVVFENPFNIGQNPENPNADPATVEASADGMSWVAFPCGATAYPWGSCAGWHPVFANADTNALDPLDPAAAGGDAFDLEALPAAAPLTEARYVRITDRADVPGDFDLDAISIVHGRCR
jgi:hypothetical protein